MERSAMKPLVNIHISINTSCFHSVINMDHQESNSIIKDTAENNNLISSQSSQDSGTSELNEDIEKENKYKFHTQDKHNTNKYRYVNYCYI